MKENYKIKEGIIAPLWTEKEEKFFWGCWSCPSCGTKGSSSKACDTEEDAIQAARTNVTIHYNASHDIETKP